ncbi:MAG TPA: hypothetical protein VI039_12905 [Solirubrobacterales bacterium]
MSRFPADEVFWRPTTGSALVSFGSNYEVLLVEPGTETPITLWSAEEGGVEVEQPLRTDAKGRALAEGGVRPWSDTANYDVLLNGQRYPRRAGEGEGGGGAVDSVNGQTGIVVLDAADVGAAPSADLEAHAADTTAVHGIADTSKLATKAEVEAEKGSREAADALRELLANKDTDGALAANSDTKYPSQKAIKTYVDGLLAAADAVVYKGVKDCSGNPNYPAASAGNLFVVSVAGKIGGASGTEVEVGDFLICKTDGSAEGTQAAVGANWNVIQTNLVGAVTGPSSATSDNIPTFNGTTGRVIKDSGKAHSTDATLAGNSDALIPTQKAVKGYVDTATGVLVPNSLVDAKGDLFAGTADNTVGRVAVGTDGQVLQADSGSAGGVKWANPSSSGEATRTKELSIGAAVLPDGSAGNAAPAITRMQGTQANPKWHGLVAAFDPGTDEHLWWTLRLPADYGSAPVVRLLWMTNDTGAGESVVWAARIGAITPADANTPLEHALAAASTVTTDVNTTEARRLIESTITLANLDGVAAGDLVELLVYRDADNGSDDLTSDAELLSVALEYEAA